MNIKQSDGIKIFTKVLTIVKKDLPKMKEDQHKDWVETCSKRLRTMLRHCQTAQNQKTVTVCARRTSARSREML